jgi:hypothetical protein
VFARRWRYLIRSVGCSAQRNKGGGREAGGHSRSRAPRRPDPTGQRETCRQPIASRRKSGAIGHRHTPTSQSPVGAFFVFATVNGQLVNGIVISSIRAITSGDSLGITATAPRLSLNCAIFDAPVMTVLTLGLRAAHAIAI